jgi:hypothetical protein
VFRLAAPHPAHRLSVGLAALALTVSALAGCGGDDGGSAAETSATTATSASETPAPTTGTSAETQSITATEADFSISLDQDTLPAGTYDIEVVNDGKATTTWWSSGTARTWPPRTPSRPGSRRR